jgi:acetylornithine deacetylase/succinyl-diaminopimelate desuccinylase-like protein
VKRSLLDLARRIIATPSVTTSGNATLAKLLASEVLAESDLAVRIDVGDHAGEVNLVATKGLERGEPLLLASHLDTVPAGDPALWRQSNGDPFGGTIDGDQLFGLGTADAKLDWLCKALALARLSGRRFSRGVIFAGTYGEESGLRGARALVQNLPARPVAAWVGEPTELRAVTRHKSLLVIRLEATAAIGERAPGGPRRFVCIQGRAAHSSTPEFGINAIQRALALVRERRLHLLSVHGGDAANRVPALCEIEVMGELEPWPDGVAVIDRPSDKVGLAQGLTGLLFDFAEETERIAAEHATTKDEAFSPPTLTSNLGRVDGDGERLEAIVDFRSLPGQPPEGIASRLEAFVAAAAERHGVKAKLIVDRNNPPLRTPETSPVVAWTRQVLAEIGLPTELAAKSGCTEAGIYAAAGIPSMVFGPGRAVGNIHAPDEHVSIAELGSAVEFYARLVEELCL